MKLKKYLLKSQFLAILLPMLLLSLINFYLISRILINEIHVRNLLLANTLAKHITEVLAEPVKLMNQVKYLYLEENNLSNAQIDELALKMIANERIFDNLEFLDKQGLVEKSLPSQPDLIGIDHSNQPFFSEIKKGATIYWSDSFISYETGSPTIIIALPFKEKVLIGYLNLKKINKMVADFSKIYEDKVFLDITDAKGVFITNLAQESINQRKKSSVFSDLQDKSEAFQKEYIAEVSGKRYIANMKRVPETKWAIIVSQDYDVAFAILYKIQLLFLIITTMIVVGVFIFTRKKMDQIVSAFLSLNQRFSEIANGRFQIRAEKSSFLELNQMADSFNYMAACLQERDARLNEMVRLDTLTGLANRFCFIQWLNEATSTKNTEQFALVFLDLDNFKGINDTYGHWIGDQVLRELAVKLQKVTTEKICLARFGGDEFVFLCKDWNKTKGITWLENLKALLAEPTKVEEYNFSFEASIGVAIFPDDSKSVDELLKYADLAMYQAKYQGKNNFKFYHHNMMAKLRRKNELEEALKNPQLFNELFLNYQPLYLRETKELRGFEALLRWQSAKLGLVSPAEFIPIAEETGRILEIGSWVLKTAIAKLAEINLEKSDKSLIMSVNISALQLKEFNFAKFVAKELESYIVQPAQLELEITESAVIDSYGEAIAVLNEIRALGIRVALDDFGTGYSSLSYLHHLPIDTIKIDRSLVADIANNNRTQDMFEGIVSLSKKLGLDIVAEGIETQEQIEILNKLRIDFFQGYFLKKPIHEKEIREFYLNLFADK